MAISNKELLINEEIRDKEIRVIDADGSQLGIMSAREAQQLAYDKNLDLVKIAPQATPPVCRIMDYGKFGHAKKFLAGGDKVKVSVRFRGREMAHPELGTVLIQRFADALAETGTIDKQPKMEGRSMVMFVSPKPVK